MKKTCLILHTGALGDCVLTIHVAMAMQRAGHTVTVAARSPIAAWAARRGMIGQSISLNRLSPLLWGSAPPFVDRGTDLLSLVKNFDHIISFLGRPDEPVAKRLTELCGPNHVIHIDPRPSEKTLCENTHITTQWIGEINRQRFDLESEISNLRFEIPDEQGQAAQSNRFKKSSTTPPHYHVATSPHVLVHPGSGGRAKCCPLDALEALVREMIARSWRAEWMIGPDEVERDGLDFQRRLERAAPVIFEESIDAAADLFAAADAFIGNDSGMTHVAALAGVSTLALFGPTNPRVWHPVGSNCVAHRFPFPNMPEMNWVETLLQMIPAAQATHTQH